MTEDERTQITAIMQTAREFTAGDRRPLSDEAVNMYLRLIDDLNPADVAASFAELLKVNDFLHTPAQIRASCAKKERERKREKDAARLAEIVRAERLEDTPERRAEAAKNLQRVLDRLTLITHEAAANE